MHLPDCSLPELLFDRALPEKIAITDPTRAVTYTELAAEILRVADGLIERGVRAGDVLAIHLSNSVDYVVAFHAALTCGGVVTPIASYATEADIATQLELTGARMTINQGVMDELREHSNSWSGDYPDCDDIACLAMSSGTTGLPKAIQLSHRNLVANTIQFSNVVPISGEDTCLAVLPLTHIYGLTALMNTPLFLGCNVITQGFTPETFLQVHETHRVNATFIAPPLAHLFATHPAVDSIDFSSLRVIVSGAAALNPTIGAKVEARLDAKIYQGYGMTEASPVTHIAQNTTTPLGSIGQLLPATEARIVDPMTLRDTEEVGELWIRGPQVMRRYLRNPDATSSTITTDGWLRTGDVARRDGDDFYIVDRLKDLILSHGIQVSPVKLETILSECPGVEDCAVVRGYAPNGEEWPVAVIVGSATDEEVIDYMAERVNRYERIREVRHVAEIPRSAAGKTLRKHLLIPAAPATSSQRTQ